MEENSNTDIFSICRIWH